MKIRVIVPFRDKAFDNKIIREEGTIIDTDLPEERCSVKLAKERIAGGFCVEVKEMPVEAPKVVKPVNKGKKVSKKR